MPRRRKPVVTSTDQAAHEIGIHADYLRKYMSRLGFIEVRGWDPRDVARARRHREATRPAPASPTQETQP